MNVTGNQTSTRDLVPYSNPNLGFSLECLSDWRKESPNFISPQGGIDNRAPEIMSIQKYCLLQTIVLIVTLNVKRQIYLKSKNKKLERLTRKQQNLLVLSL
jgi:hypothetical protein